MNTITTVGNNTRPLRQRVAPQHPDFMDSSITARQLRIQARLTALASSSNHQPTPTYTKPTSEPKKTPFCQELLNDVPDNYIDYNFNPTQREMILSYLQRQKLYIIFDRPGCASRDNLLNKPILEALTSFVQYCHTNGISSSASIYLENFFIQKYNLQGLGLNASHLKTKYKDLKKGKKALTFLKEVQSIIDNTPSTSGVSCISSASTISNPTDTSDTDTPMDIDPEMAKAESSFAQFLEGMPYSFMPAAIATPADAGLDLFSLTFAAQEAPKAPIIDPTNFKGIVDFLP